MRTSVCSLFLMLSAFFVGGCGATSTGGSGQPAPSSINTLFGQDVTFLADRAINGPSSGSQLPSDPLSESDYKALPQNKSYAVSFAVDGNTVTITGETTMMGTWNQQAGGTRRFDLTSGVFAGGRFDVWSGDTAFNAELTMYGSGVPIVSSERGTLVE